MKKLRKKKPRNSKTKTMRKRRTEQTDWKGLLVQDGWVGACRFILSHFWSNKKLSQSKYLSSPCAKRAGPGCYWQTVPPQWGGVRLFDGSSGFCLGGFSVMLVPKLLLTPIKIRIFGPKPAKLGPKSAFLVILGQILPFFAHFVQCSTNQRCEQGAWVGFPLCG